MGSPMALSFFEKLSTFNHEILDWNFDESDNESDDDYVSDQGYVSGYE